MGYKEDSQSENISLVGLLLTVISMVFLMYYANGFDLKEYIYFIWSCFTMGLFLMIFGSWWKNHNNR